MKIKEIKFFDVAVIMPEIMGNRIVSARCGNIEIAILYQQLYHDGYKEIMCWYIRPTGILKFAYDYGQRESTQFFYTREFKTEKDAKFAVEAAFTQFMNLFIE